MKRLYLSYPITSPIPVYGNPAESIALASSKSIAKGDSCQVSCFQLENHWGTHVDCPAHFFETGQRPQDIEPDFWVFEHPQVISVALNPGELMTQSHLLEPILAQTDVLIFKSDWGEKRGSVQYSCENPGIHHEFAVFLRMNYPQIRAIGLDWISVSSYLKRDEGRKTHQAFLDPVEKGHPIFLIEDMNLAPLTTSLLKLYVFPLIIQGADSANCIIIGEQDD